MSPSPLRVLSSLAGTGLSCESAEQVKVLSEIDALAQAWHRPLDAKEATELVSGSWRLVWTSSDSLRVMSSLPGGSVDAMFESIAEGTSYQTALSHAPMYGLLAFVVVGINLTVAVLVPLGFFGGMLLALVAFSALRGITPAGLYVTRRTEVKVDSDLVVTSQMERMVIVFSANACDFDVSLPDPMARFKARFEASPATKDRLKHGLLFGWRLARKPWGLHVMPATRTMRRERILFADATMRIMEGGDVLSDGTTSDAVSVYVRV